MPPSALSDVDAFPLWPLSRQFAVPARRFSPGVYWAAEAVETAVAETIFYRLLFFAESADTPWPRNPLEFTGFETRYAVEAAIDLTAPPLSRDRRAGPTLPTIRLAWRWPTPRARRVSASSVTRSVRDPQGRANLALLTCTAFVEAKPSAYVDVARLALRARSLCDVRLAGTAPCLFGRQFRGRSPACRPESRTA